MQDETANSATVGPKRTVWTESAIIGILLLCVDVGKGVSLDSFGCG